MNRSVTVELVLLGVLSGGGLGVQEAYARGEDTPASIVPKTASGKRSQKELAVEAIDIRLQSHTVKDLQLKSAIEDASGGIVESGEVGRSVIATNPGISLRPDVIVARKGDVVSVPRPHKRELAPGVYSETVRVAVTDSSYSVPVVVAQTRFFRVSQDGVEEISNQAFSSVVDGPGRTARNRMGNPVVVQDGKAFPRGSAKGSKVASPKRGPDGRIENLDAAVSLPPVPTQSGADERNEK